MLAGVARIRVARFVPANGRAALRGLIIAALCACTPAPVSPTPPHAPAASPVTTPTVIPAPDRLWEQALVPDRPPEPAPPRCDEVACWQAMAAAASRAGALDVAAAHHGRVFALAANDAHLARWIDALVTSGDLPGARQALASVSPRARLGPAIDRHRQTLAATSEPPPPQPAALQAAYAAEAAGRVDEALALFARALTARAEPVDLVHAAELHHAHGDRVTASRLWSAARVHIRQRGELQMLATSRWFPNAITWHGDDVVTLHTAHPIAPAFEQDVSTLLLRSADRRVPDRQLWFPRWGAAFALSDDGQTLLGATGWGFFVAQDIASGAVLQRFECGRRLPGILAATGDGDALQVLGALGPVVQLWDARGQQLDRFELGTWHAPGLRELGERPIAPTALALTPTRIAIGGEDGRVRLHDRPAGTQHTLTLAGPAASANSVLALRFVAAGEQLVAVHQSGDISTWDTRTGALLRRVSGQCDEAELILMSTIDDPPGHHGSPTAYQREKCNHAQHASIAPDGDLVATSGRDNAIRVRDTRDGASRFHLSDRHLWGNNLLALNRGGQLALLDDDQGLTRWQPGQAAVVPVTPGVPRAEGWSLSASGRLLTHPYSGWSRIWDLIDRRALEARRRTGERLIAISGDGRHAAIADAEGLEFRDPVTRATILRGPAGTYMGAWQVDFAGAHALIRGDTNAGTHVADLATRTLSRIDLPETEKAMTLSPDGRWLATWAEPGTAPTPIRSVATGTVAHTLADDVRALAFSPDGAWLVWLVDVGRIEARALRLAEPRPRIVRLAAGRGSPSNVAFTPDGEALFMVDGDLTRWRPATGRHITTRYLDIGGTMTLHVPDAGKVLLVQHGDSIDIFASAPRPRRVASLYGLHNGGWLAISAAGAIDGSADAVEHLLARTAPGHGPKTYADWVEAFSGRLVWDAAHVPGVIARALTGEDVQPPLPISPPSK